MNLIYISPSPPNDLERVRSLNILKILKKNNVNITLVTLYNKKQEKYLKDLEKYVDKIIKVKQNKIVSLIKAGVSFVLPIPTRVGYCFSFKMRRTLKKLNTKYDVLYIKRLRMAQYKKYVKSNKVFIDITDSLTKYYERLYKNEKSIKKLFYLEEYLKLKKYEIKICKENENIIICSKEDKKYLVNIEKEIENNIKVIENVVDISKWNKEKYKIKETRKNLCFFGVMSYEANIISAKYLIKNIMPKLDKRYKLNIIGPNVPKNLKKLENENIKFLGYVKSAPKELVKNDIFLCPILVGAGTKNKILQVGELKMPIVATTLALEGLPEELKEVVFLANTKEEFIEKIEEVQNMKKEKLEKRLDKQKQIIEKYNSMEFIENKIKQYVINEEK